MIFQHHSHKFILIFQFTLPMAVPQKQMWGHRPQHSHNQLNNNYAGLHTYWSNQLSAWYVGSWAHHLTHILTCTISGSMAAYCTMPLDHNYQPETNTLYGSQNSSLGLASLRWFFRSQWPVSQVIVTLVSEQPWPRRASHSKQWHPLGSQTTFMAHQVIHGYAHPTHTLHPTLGIACALLHQEGQVPPPASPAITNCTFVPAPAILFLPFSFLLLSLTFKQTSNYTEVSVLRCWASAYCDHKWTYNNGTSWDQNNHKWFY